VTLESLALELLDVQRTLVLATSDPDPWSAPVYFVHQGGRLLFFSSPRSRHVLAAAPGRRCAGSVHRDGDDWRMIEGLQMEGSIVEVPDGPEVAGAIGAYVRKFPTVKDLLGQEAPDLRRFDEVLGARLYAFLPERAFYVNNQAGLVGRREIRLPRG
jgi:uncharacterized protein YhbP (UPF0306 family)